MNSEIDFTPYVPQVHYELIPIKNLVSNQDYQQEPIPKTCTECCGKL